MGYCDRDCSNFFATYLPDHLFRPLCRVAHRRIYFDVLIHRSFCLGDLAAESKAEVTLTTTPPPPGPKSEPPKTTATSENTTRQNPKREAVGRKKKISTAATTAPNPLPPAQAQTTLPSQQVGVGIVNNAPNNGTQVVQDNRQYGVSPPPPDLDFHQSQIEPWPEPLLGTGPMARREKDMEMLVGPNAGHTDQESQWLSL